MKTVLYVSLLTGVLGAMAGGCAVEPPAPAPTSDGAAATGGWKAHDEPIEIGYISRWCGKVNMIWNWTSWQPDPDCTSGCNIDPLTYCRKFWPLTNYVAQTVASVKTGWVNQGCVATNEAAAGEDWICLM